MRKEQLLTFVPNVDEKFASTNRIAKRASINHYKAQRLLTELYIMKRPLVEKYTFGGDKKTSRDFILWRKTAIDKNALNKALKVKPEDRDDGEHEVILRDYWGGSFHQYLNDILKQGEIIK